jgi:large repetitive protein
VTAYEDNPQTIHLVASDAEGDALTYFVISQPSAGVVSGPGPDVLFVPAAGFQGQVSFTFEVHDPAASSAPAQVTINVLPSNDAPTFDTGDNPVTPVGTTTIVTISGFATGMSAGPADESGQAIQFVVTGNTAPALFVQAPQIDAATGDLTFQPTGVKGSAVITVVLVDDGGTQFGGVDTSLPRSFSIYVGKPPKKKKAEEEEQACSTAAEPGPLVALLLFILIAALGRRRLRDG